MTMIAYGNAARRVLNTLLIMLFVFRLVFSKDRQGYAITLAELWDQCRALGGRAAPGAAGCGLGGLQRPGPSWTRPCSRVSIAEFLNRPAWPMPASDGKGTGSSPWTAPR